MQNFLMALSDHAKVFGSMEAVAVLNDIRQDVRSLEDIVMEERLLNI